jgi:hypothetical protein
MRWDHRPTRWGWGDVQADGSIVSRALAKPWMMLNPLTLAVIEPSETAASAVVEICPIVITETITSEYSRT